VTRAKIWRYVAIVVPVLVVSACVAVACEIYREMKGDPDDLPDTISQAEAIERLDALAHEVIGVLPSQARPVNAYGAARADVRDTCEIGLEKKRSGQVRVTVAYEVFDLDPARYPEYIDTVAQYARAKGWSVDGNPRLMSLSVPSQPGLWLSVHTTDGFFVTGESNCIWPEGHRPGT
jgi:hypothetical protein